MDKFSKLGQYTLQDAKVVHELRPCGCNPYTAVFLIQYLELKCVGKTIRDAKKNEKNVDRFAEECRILSELRHPNIVQFLGVCSQGVQDLPILVMEFLPINLTECITQYGILQKEISNSILYDVSLGLHYLHSQTPPIIHRDLTSHNVLLSSNMTAKISDLSMIKILQHVHQQAEGGLMTQNPGNPDFMPPEAKIANPNYNTCLDVFSYGIMMIHIFSGRWPAPQTVAVKPEKDGRLVGVSEADQRTVFLEIIGSAHPHMDLIRRCIHNDVKERPCAKDLVERFSLLRIPTSESISGRLKMLKSVVDMNEEVSSSGTKGSIDIVDSTMDVDSNPQGTVPDQKG